jgi:predicted RNA-binding Zn-ribbon protein involved in translation (DUF1610 family)
MRKRRIFAFLVLTLVVMSAGIGARWSTNACFAQTQSDSTSLSCPKCKGSMESGLVRDYFSLNSADCYQSKWSEGLPKVFGRHDSAKKILTYRCTQCGYLESYAR